MKISIDDTDVGEVVSFGATSTRPTGRIFTLPARTEGISIFEDITIKRTMSDDDIVEMVEEELSREEGTLFGVEKVYDRHHDLKAKMRGGSHYALFTAQDDARENGVWFYSQKHALHDPSSACEQWFRARDFKLAVGSVVIVGMEGQEPTRDVIYAGTMWVCIRKMVHGLYSIETHYALKGNAPT